MKVQELIKKLASHPFDLEVKSSGRTVSYVGHYNDGATEHVSLCFSEEEMLAHLLTQEEFIRRGEMKNKLIKEEEMRKDRECKRLQKLGELELFMTFVRHFAETDPMNALQKAAEKMMEQGYDSFKGWIFA
jgi:hypothetical protein